MPLRVIACSSSFGAHILDSFAEPAHLGGGGFERLAKAVAISRIAREIRLCLAELQDEGQRLFERRHLCRRSQLPSRVRGDLRVEFHQTFRRRRAELPGRHFSQHVALPARIARDFVGALHHAFVSVEPEQVAENLAACRAIAAQEAVELALRQYDGLGEAIEVEADNLLDALAQFSRGVSDRFPFAVAVAFNLRAAGALAFHDAQNAIGNRADFELEQHFELWRALGDQFLRDLFAEAWSLAVERENDAVDERGFARAGGSGDAEEVEGGEVDFGAFAEADEAFDFEAGGAHGLGPSVLFRAARKPYRAATAGSGELRGKDGTGTNRLVEIPRGNAL